MTLAALNALKFSRQLIPSGSGFIETRERGSMAVRIPMSESEEQRKLREMQKKPQPMLEFTACRIERAA